MSPAHLDVSVVQVFKYFTEHGVVVHGIILELPICLEDEVCTVNTETCHFDLAAPLSQQHTPRTTICTGIAPILDSRPGNISVVLAEGNPAIGWYLVGEFGVKVRIMCFQLLVASCSGQPIDRPPCQNVLTTPC